MLSMVEQVVCGERGERGGAGGVYEHGGGDGVYSGGGSLPQRASEWEFVAISSGD